MLMVSLLAASTAMAGSVTIKGPRPVEGGPPDIVVDLASVSQHFDVDDEYDIRSGSGSVRSERIRGISIDKLFAVANADPTYHGVSVLRPNGGEVFISKAQVTAGVPSPVIYESNGEVRFLRPSSSADDNNADDLVSSAGNLILQQTASSALKITAKASKTKVAARKLVTFAATVTGAGSGETPEISWLFDDGKSGSGDTVSHRYSKRGVYRVLATVKTGNAQHSTVVTVQVGKPVVSKRDRTGGGNNDAANAPDSGASDGNSGDGDAAATDEPAEKSKPKEERSVPPKEQLPTITGQVIDPSAASTVETQSDLAARTGSKTTDPDPDQANSGGVPREAIGIAGAIGLLGLGFFLELGALSGLRSRLTIG